MPVAFALCLLLTPPSLTAPVTVKYTGRVADLLAQISKQSGTALAAGKKEGAEILIVALDKAPLDETMERIAWATFGAWERDKDGYKLVHDVAEERRAEKAFRESSIAFARDAIARFQVTVQALKPTEEYLRPKLSPDLVGQAPIVRAGMARLLARLVADMPLAPLGSISSMEEVATYSNLPTPAQHPLGPSAEKALKEYIAEGDVALEGRRPSRIVLKGNVTPLGGSLLMSLYTARGEAAGPSSFIALMAEKPIVAVPKEILDAVPDDMEVPLSTISKAFRHPEPENYDIAYPSPQEWNGMASFTERLRDPERFEPLATLTTDIWTATASRMGRNLVMNVDDANLIPWRAGKPSPLEFYLREPSLEQIELQTGWLVGRPPLLNSPWGHRVDRAALGRYVRCLYPYRSLGQLEAGADFIGKCGVPGIPYWLGTYVYWASKGNLTSDGSGGWRLERFYSVLPDAARQAWISGQAVPIATLPPAAKRELWRWAMGSRYSFEAGGTPPAEVMREETVRFPTGQVTSGWLRAERKEDKGYAVRIPRQEGGFGERWDSPSSLAGLLSAMTSGSNDVQIHPAMQQTLRMYAELAGDPAVPEKTLTYYVSEPSQYVPVGKLPSDVAASIRTGKVPGG